MGTDAALALEVGPGKVLQGLWKDANPSIPCQAAGTCADIDALTGGNNAS
jgi:[acyl-carrier-protein] S-malonyltransferase